MNTPHLKPFIWLLVLTAVLAGCQTSDKGTDPARGPTGPVPMTARLIEEGRGEMTFKAPEDGVLYLFDTNTQRVLATQRLEKGQVFFIDPSRNRMMLDWRTVNGQSLTRDHNHRLYFDRDAVGKRRTDR